MKPMLQKRAGSPTNHLYSLADLNRPALNLDECGEADAREAGAGLAGVR